MGEYFKLCANGFTLVIHLSKIIQKLQSDKKYGRKMQITMDIVVYKNNLAIRMSSLLMGLFG